MRKFFNKRIIYAVKSGYRDPLNGRYIEQRHSVDSKANVQPQVKGVELNILPQGTRDDIYFTFYLPSVPSIPDLPSDATIGDEYIVYDGKAYIVKVLQDWNDSAWFSNRIGHVKILGAYTAKPNIDITQL